MLRRFLTFIPVILLLGSSLLLFLINLAGTRDSGVLSRYYWSETNTSGISGSDFSRTRWTPYGICGVKDGRNSDCVKHSPAYPYSPRDNFKSSSGLPSSFNKSRDTYYYLSRFAYALFLVGLVFSLLSILPIIASCCGIGFLTGMASFVVVGLALLFTLTATCLITAAHVKGRNAFNSAGHHSSLGVKMFAMAWAASACLLLAFAWTIMMTVLGIKRKLGNRNEKSDSEADHKSETSSSSYHYNGTVAQNPYERQTGYQNNDGYVANANDESSFQHEGQEEQPRFKFFHFKKANPDKE